MKAYHGSIKTNLQELKPFAKSGSTINQPRVYMTTYKTHAALYIWDKPFYWFTYGFDNHGRIHYEEYFPHALTYFYKGKQGAIYTCEGDFETTETDIRNLVTSPISVKITEKEIIDDAYEYLTNAENKGEITITRYPQLSENRKNSIKIQIEQIVKAEPPASKEESEFIKLICSAYLIQIP